MQTAHMSPAGLTVAMRRLTARSIFCWYLVSTSGQSRAVDLAHIPIHLALHAWDSHSWRPLRKIARTVHVPVFLIKIK